MSGNILNRSRSPPPPPQGSVPALGNILQRRREVERVEESDSAATAPPAPQSEPAPSPSLEEDVKKRYADRMLAVYENGTEEQRKRLQAWRRSQFDRNAIRGLIDNAVARSLPRDRQPPIGGRKESSLAVMAELAKMFVGEIVEGGESSKSPPLSLLLVLPLSFRAFSMQIWCYIWEVFRMLSKIELSLSLMLKYARGADHGVFRQCQRLLHQRSHHRGYSRYCQLAPAAATS
ncbi:unnamed protein product [Phaeothamnion confervicola]